MKKWNSPEIEVLEIGKTENGKSHSFIETNPNCIYPEGSHADSLCELAGLVFGIPCEHEASKGNDVTPSTEDNTDITDKLS